MINVALLCAGVLLGQMTDRSRSSAELKTYEALKVKAGRDPGAQVKLALWCEAHGLGAERMRHLAKAVLTDPANAAARGLLGMLEFDKRWETVERALARIEADDSQSAKRAEYVERRAKLTALEIRSQDSRALEEQDRQSQAAYAARAKSDRRLAQAHVNLARWCEANGLKPEAAAHFTAAIHFDPYRDSAWKHLGYVERDGRWTSREQAAIDDQDERAQKHADRYWEPLIIPVLESAADAPATLGEDEDAWHRWWFDTLGYSYQPAPKPTFIQQMTSQYQPPYIRTCFAAGTPVQTQNGARPIEAIEIGDRVLSQDAATGALSFQPVVFVHRNPPDKTLGIRLSDGDTVVCSVYHRFWRANLGWTQARQLKPGDALRQMGSIVRVDSIETDSVQAVYNLDVATSRTFFVGASKLLVHDNTLPDHRLVPFDALPPGLATGPPASR